MSKFVKLNRHLFLDLVKFPEFVLNLFFYDFPDVIVTLNKLLRKFRFFKVVANN